MPLPGRRLESPLFCDEAALVQELTDDHKKEWKDVIRYRADERGDVICRIGLDEALARHAALGSSELPDTEKDSSATPGAARLPVLHFALDRIGDLARREATRVHNLFRFRAAGKAGGDRDLPREFKGRQRRGGYA